MLGSMVIPRRTRFEFLTSICDICPSSFCMQRVSAPSIHQRTSPVLTILVRQHVVASHFDCGATYGATYGTSPTVVQPPSSMSVWPVTILALGDTR